MNVKRISSTLVLLLLLWGLAGQFFNLEVPTVKAQDQKVFGNSSLPDWKNVILQEYSANIIVDTGDGFVWEFPKDKDKFNQIYQNGTLIVKDEQWLLVGADLKEDSHPISGLEWNQPEPYHVIIKDFYQDLKKNNNFSVIYDFYGGFRPKISFNASIGTFGNYTVDWRCWVYKNYALNMANYVEFWNEGEEPIVFDYTDVYESFGNITEADVSGWFKGKRFDQKFKIGALTIGEFSLDPNFGYETKGSGLAANKNRIWGSWFTCPESGTAQNITFYIKQYSTKTPKIKCAIYKKSDNSCVATTEEWTLTSGWDDWKTFTITSGGSLTNQDYYLVLWSSDFASLYYVSETGKHGYQDITYDGFPDSWNPTTGNAKISSYCTYTTEEGDTTSPTYSNVGTNTTHAGEPCKFYAQWQDNVNLSHYIFSWNATDSWANETAVAFSNNPDWSNVTKTLPSSVGKAIGWRIYANDTASPCNWNNTGIQTLTTSDTSPPTFSDIGKNSTLAGENCLFYCRWVNLELSGFIFGTNNTGSWQNDTWTDPWSGTPTSGWSNVTKTLTSSVGVTVQYQFWCNDTSNNWGTTDLQSLTTTDTSAPTYSNLGKNTTQAETSCKFYCQWSNLELSGFIFGWNGTGSWTNDSWSDPWSGAPTSGWSNVTKTLPSEGTVVGWRIYCNDTSNNWGDTGIQVFTTSAGEDYEAPTYSNIGHTTFTISTSCTFYCKWQDNSALSGYIFGTNNTGSWQNETWASLSGNSAWANVTKTLTSTEGARVEYCWWCNDTSNNWNNTGILWFTTTAPPPSHIGPYPTPIYFDIFIIEMPLYIIQSLIPTFDVTINIVNKNLKAMDVVFKYWLTDAETRENIFEKTDTIFISGLDKKDVTIKIPYPEKPREYTFHVTIEEPKNIITNGVTTQSFQVYDVVTWLLGPGLFLLVIIVAIVILAVVVWLKHEDYL